MNCSAPATFFIDGILLRAPPLAASPESPVFAVEADGVTPPDVAGAEAIILPCPAGVASAFSSRPPAAAAAEDENFGFFRTGVEPDDPPPAAATAAAVLARLLTFGSSFCAETGAAARGAAGAGTGGVGADSADLGEGAAGVEAPRKDGNSLGEVMKGGTGVAAALASFVASEGGRRSVAGEARAATSGAGCSVGGMRFASENSGDTPVGVSAGVAAVAEIG